jgi:hypothetical protein
VQGQPATPAGAAQFRSKTGLFLGGNLNHNLSRHGRSSGAIRLIGVFPVSFLKTAVAFTALRQCPIWLWPELACVS